MSLKPFFTYYGGKYRAAPHYPAPLYNRIMEPFCGSAGYSLRYADRKIRLYDKDETIVALWQYLIRATPKEILRLPDLKDGDVTDNLRLPQEAKSLIGFWLNKGSSSPGKTPSKWMRSRMRPNSYWGPAVRERIATQLASIRHWKAKLQSYETCPDVRATWFVDPPYQGKAGTHYKVSDVDYEDLGVWCQARRGQVIVCENSGAAWLPFKDFRSIKATPGAGRMGSSKETIWYRERPCRSSP